MEGIITKMGYTSKPATGSNTGGAKIQFGDAARASFGGVDDLEIYHGGGVDHNYIDSRKFGSGSGTGILKIRTNQRDAIVVNNSGSVELYDASTNPSTKRLETSATGITITGLIDGNGGANIVGGSTLDQLSLIHI